MPQLPHSPYRHRCIKGPLPHDQCFRNERRASLSRLLQSPLHMVKMPPALYHRHTVFQFISYMTPFLRFLIRIQISHVNYFKLFILSEFLSRYSFLQLPSPCFVFVSLFMQSCSLSLCIPNQSAFYIIKP